MSSLIDHNYLKEIIDKVFNGQQPTVSEDNASFSVSIIMKQFLKEYNDIEFAKESEGEYILGVSMYIKDRRGGSVTISIPRPYRHQHLFQLRSEHFGIDIPDKAYYDEHKEYQGFYSNKRKFLSREQALVVARNANQLIQKTQPHYELFSEDLWSNVIMFDKEGNDIKESDD